MHGWVSRVSTFRRKSAGENISRCKELDWQPYYKRNNSISQHLVLFCFNQNAWHAFLTLRGSVQKPLDAKSVVSKSRFHASQSWLVSVYNNNFHDHFTHNNNNSSCYLNPTLYCFSKSAHHMKTTIMISWIDFELSTGGGSCADPVSSVHLLTLVPFCSCFLQLDIRWVIFDTSGMMDSTQCRYLLMYLYHSLKCWDTGKRLLRPVYRQVFNVFFFFFCRQKLVEAVLSTGIFAFRKKVQN